MFKIDLHHLPYADEDVRRLAHIATGEISEGEAYDWFMKASTAITDDKIHPLYGTAVYLAEETRVAWGYSVHGSKPGLSPGMTQIAEPKTCPTGNLYIWTITDAGNVPCSGEPQHAFNLIRTRAIAYMKKHNLRRMTDEVYEIMYGEST